MNAKDFASQLASENESLLCELAPASQILAESEKINVKKLLRMALKNEIEATELAAHWLPSTPEIDVKLGFARQAGDEAKHYRLIEERLRELGEDLTSFSPLGQGHSPLFQYLLTLEGTVERVAAGQFTREAIALIKNRQFIEFALAVGDEKTARLYSETIQPDEKFHHELGHKFLEKYAATEALQEQARSAARRTLELAEEFQELALVKMGVHHAPGC
jgi:uncharacterized ferritin-like protein (DUF455 family)